MFFILLSGLGRTAKSFDRDQLSLNNTWYFHALLLFAFIADRSYTYAISSLFLKHRFAAHNISIEGREHSLNNLQMRGQLRPEYG